MTDNLYIPRQLVQRWIDNTDFFEDLRGKSMAEIDKAKKEDDLITEELRTLLAAPVVEAATCAQCSASTSDICNQNGCGYLESGNGAPVVERQPTPWSYCPECGCEELHHEQGEHKQCANCYQKWFSDIDYSEVVRGNLAKLKSSPPAPVAVVPDGWRLVPLSPTMDMLEALMEWNKVGNVNAYNNILSAIPAYPDKLKELNQ